MNGTGSLFPRFQQGYGKNIQISHPILSFVERCLLKTPLRFIKMNPPKTDLEDIVNSKFNIISHQRGEETPSLNSLAKWISRVLRMSKDKKPWNIWEYLGMGENTSGNFWEFLGIPNNSKFEANCLWNVLELLGIAKTPIRIYGNS